jgi:hypothetical protein
MQIFSLSYFVSAAILLTTNFAFADGQAQQQSSETASKLKRPPTEMLVAQSTRSGQRSIIIVSGKNSQPGSRPESKFNNPVSKIGNPGSKVMLNPQPLPPKSR